MGSAVYWRKISPYTSWAPVPADQMMAPFWNRFIRDPELNPSVSPEMGSPIWERL